MPKAKIINKKTLDVTGFLIFYNRKVTELMGISLSASLQTVVNSTVCNYLLVEMLTGFGFQAKEKWVKLFLQIPSEFSKTFFEPKC